MKFSHALTVVSALTLFSACGSKTEAPAEQAAPATTEQTQSAPAQVSGATIGGSVKFAGAKPAAKNISMSADAYCKTQHATTVASEEVIVNANNTLKNVYVYVKSGLEGKTFPAPAEPAVLDQMGCMYTPHVLAVQVGQEVVVRNSDGVLHNVNARPKTNKGFNVGQPVKGMEAKKQFDQPEVMIPLKCDVHPWMNGYIGVQNHPFAAVTGDDGSFSLKGLPAGTYELEAWHEKYGTAKQTVTIGENETKSVDFTFKG